MTNAASLPAVDDGTPDAELAARVAARDGAAFEVLMRRHNRRLFRVARAILRSDQDAEDALQDAYLAAYRAIGRFRGDSKLATWLTRIVINEAYARLRKMGGATVIALPEGHDMTAEMDPTSTAAPAETPDRAALRAELRQLLERHIDALPEQFRTAFMLREVEELTVEEAAEALGVPEATVRTRAHRARALLRAALAHDIDVATLDAFGFAGERCDRIVQGVLAQLPAAAADPTNQENT
ncbi:MAG TPA: RNA polymerase sigma factor [Casimicrobiaceae bacterium]|nr:RNA polymerase sigma factor [Casimicrobiaceae bacterium]